MKRVPVASRRHQRRPRCPRVLPPETVGLARHELLLPTPLRPSSA